VFFGTTCRPSPGWLEQLAATLDVYGQVGAVGPVIVAPGSPAPIAGLALVRREDDMLEASARYQKEALVPQVGVTALPSLAVMYRREAFEEAGGFDETYRDGLADIDLGLELGEAGWASLVDLMVTVPLAGPLRTSAGPAGEDVAAFTERWPKATPDVETPGPAEVTARAGTARLAGNKWGANIVGYFEAELGIGQSARLVVGAIEAAGGSCATYSWYRHHSRAGHKFHHRGRALGRYPFPVDIVCLNGDMLPYFAAEHADTMGGRYTVGSWHWELEELPPNYVRALDLLDEVWVGSEFTRKAVAASTDKPVVTVPLPVPVRDGRPPHSRDEAGIPEGFVFGFMFDARSTMGRKNPEGAIAAFCQAFAPDEGPLLVVRVTNGDWDGTAARLRSLAGGRPDVVVVDRHLSPGLAGEWTGLVDCYVSLHRSEGFGLSIAEAMSWGTPVIATGYSGNLDFTTRDNAFLADWSPAVVPLGNPSYPAGGHWAEPDVKSAAALMRRVWEHPGAARERGERGRRDLRLTHSLGAAAQVVSMRAEEIRRTVRGPGWPRRQSPEPLWRPGPLPAGERKPATLRLNLGAGDDKKDGYLSVDLRRDVADVLADVTALPFTDESAAELFASDLLEHFPAPRTQQILAEWHRVLAPGGKLTLRVPNLLALAQLIVQYPHTRPDVIRNIYGGHRWGPDGAWDTHHTGWVPEMLHAELERAGFLVMNDDGDLNNTVTAMRLGS
jgi:glycosyltransferase involved in cell wall biosynthesis